MAADPDPKKLFQADHTYERPLLSQIITPVGCAFVGVLCAFTLNYATLRPLLSGIQKHIMFGLSGGVVGKVVDDWRLDYYAERDAVIRHYIQTHPEDFPAPERLKLKEMFKPWLPIR